MDGELTKLWAVELSLLEEFKRICNKLDLRYCAAYGTLLGAVRHQGFIPWDDDMDFFMMWPDYQKLMKAAPTECRYPFFFQGIYSEQDSMVVACRLRRSDTTGFTKWEQENAGPGYNMGIFIDIFPLFYVPDLPEERARQKEEVMHLWRCVHGHDALIRLNRGDPVSKQYESFIPEYLSLCQSRGISEVGDPDIVWLKEEYLSACAWDGKKTREVGATATRCHAPKELWDAQWFENSVELPRTQRSLARASMSGYSKGSTAIGERPSETAANMKCSLWIRKHRGRSSLQNRVRAFDH